jgi:Na+/melibiose symporter-like transporter
MRFPRRAHFLDLFKIVGKNKQLLRVVIAMFLYYLAAGLLTGIGLNYFYLLFGYGGDKGGFVASLLSVVYVVGTLASQVFYPLMAKKFRKQNILTVCTVVIILTYVAFLFFAFPIFGGKPLAYNDPSTASSSFAFALGGTMWLLYLPDILLLCRNGRLLSGLIGHVPGCHRLQRMEVRRTQGIHCLCLASFGCEAGFGTADRHP